jgi:hypothetical protein
MLFAACLHVLKCRYVLGHEHRLRAGHLLERGIAHLVIRMCVAREKDLGVLHLEAE